MKSAVRCVAHAVILRKRKTMIKLQTFYRIESSIFCICNNMRVNQILLAMKVEFLQQIDE